jgi:hypothetical protein
MDRSYFIGDTVIGDTGAFSFAYFFASGAIGSFLHLSASVLNLILPFWTSRLACMDMMRMHIHSC